MPLPNNPSRYKPCVAVLSMSVLGLAGCTATFDVPPIGTPTPSSAIHGHVFGGQQPVTGSAIDLIPAGLTGYGSGAKSLLIHPIISDASGSFDLTNDYNCPDTPTEVYLTAKGGNPGLHPAVDNSAIFLVAPLGLCSNLKNINYVAINEATTVAAAFALAQFTDVKKETIGSTSTNTLGLQNAFATVNNLVNIETGLPLTTTPTANGGNGIAPQGEMNTLADALAACVNSSGTGSDPCQTLLPDVTPPTLTQAKDIYQAALYIALYPATDITDVLGLASATSPFQPIMKKAPNDWTMGILYSGAGISYPGGLQIDQLGNIWVVSNPLYAGAVSKLSPLGTPLSPALEGFDIGYVVPGPSALDTSGNFWMASPDTGSGNSGVIELDNKGNLLSPNTLETVGYGVNTLLFPQALALDNESNVWIAAGGSILVELDKSGNVVSPTTSPSTTLLKGYPISSNVNAFALGIAIDSNDKIWVANGGLDSLAELDNNGTLVSPDAGFTGGGLDGQVNGNNSPVNVAVDGQGFIWTTNTSAGTASEFVGSIADGGTAPPVGPTGTPLSPAGGYSGTGGIYDPSGIIVDGAGNIWMTNPAVNSVTELTQSAFNASPSDGYGGAGFNGPQGIGIDPSGNVWVANFGSGFNGTVTEVVGAAGPTVTPITPTMIGSMP